MADMTLEQVRDSLREVGLNAGNDYKRAWAYELADAIDAAIRERDRLRGDVSGMTEELLRLPSREEWCELQKRAERAEAELATLKARIAALPVEYRDDGRWHVLAHTHLVVEE